MICPCCGCEMTLYDWFNNTRTKVHTANVWRCHPCENDGSECTTDHDRGYLWTEYLDKPPHDLEPGFDPRGYVA